jgi:hypothetical protein
VSRRPLEPVEVACPTCGLIAELYRPRGARPPKLCRCPAPERVTPVRRRRVCVSCTTVLNRYNRGEECGACRIQRESARPAPPGGAAV